MNEILVTSVIFGVNDFTISGPDNVLTFTFVDATNFPPLNLATGVLGTVSIAINPTTHPQFTGPYEVQTSIVIPASVQRIGLEMGSAIGTPGDAWFPGGNGNGQTASSFASCDGFLSREEPQALVDLGLPDSHIVLAFRAEALQVSANNTLWWWGVVLLHGSLIGPSFVILTLRCSPFLF